MRRDLLFDQLYCDAGIAQSKQLVRKYVSFIPHYEKNQPFIAIDNSTAERNRIAAHPALQSGVTTKRMNRLRI